MITLISMIIVGTLLGLVSFAGTTLLLFTIIPDNKYTDVLGWIGYITGFMVFIFFCFRGWKSYLSEKQDMDGRESLTMQEKIFTWTLNLLVTPAVGSILYFTWKNKEPRKAHEANTISFFAFLFWMGAVLYYKYK